MQGAPCFHAMMALRRVSVPFILFPPFISLGETCCVPALDILEKGLVMGKATGERLERGGGGVGRASNNLCVFSHMPPYYLASQKIPSRHLTLVL